MTKTNSLKKIATMLMAVVMAFATLSTTALAAESDFLNNEIICEEVDSQRSSSATVRFEVESWENPKQYGRFVATSDSISIRFSQCVEGSALVEFHRGSYNGPVDASIIMPSPNNLPTTVTTNRNVQSGATYYTRRYSKMCKECQAEILCVEAEDADGLTPVKDDNENTRNLCRQDLCILL